MLPSMTEAYGALIILWENGAKILFFSYIKEIKEPKIININTPLSLLQDTHVDFTRYIKNMSV